MANCATCGLDLHVSWRHCPVCGPSNMLRCSGCRSELQAAWKACPFCGEVIQSRGAAQAGKPSVVAGDDPEVEPWSLYLRLKHVFEEPLMALVAAGQKEGQKLNSLLAATDDTQCERAAAAAIRAVVTALQSDPYLPRHPVLQDVSGRITQAQTALLSLLSPALSGQRSRLEEVRKLGVTDNDAVKLLKAVGEAVSTESGTGLAVAAGSFIGHAIFPGIGGIVGGGLGGYLAGSQTDKQRQEALAKYAEASSHAVDTAAGIFTSLWDQLLAGLNIGPGGRALPINSHFRQAAEQWERLAPTITNASSTRETQEGIRQILAFIEQWGPSPDALHYIVRLSLPPRTSDITIAATHAEQQQRLYPWIAVSSEDSADVAIERREFAAACACAQTGRAHFPQSPGLWVSHIEALAAMGSMGAAYAEEAAARKTEIGRSATFHCVRGLIRGGRDIEAAVMIGRWMGEDGRPAAIAKHLRDDVVTNRLIAEHQLVVPAGVDGELAAIIEAKLKADASRFFGEPPTEILQNAIKEYLALRSGERILYFRDWSVWKNGKTGFVITNQRILWKCMWEATVAIELHEVDTKSLSHADNYLLANGLRVDIEDKEEAAILVETLRELRSAVSA